MATDGFWAAFGRWRHRRPFWGSFLMILSGIELFYSANMDLGHIQFHIGPQGFLSYLIPGLVALTGILAMFSPSQRAFYGIIGVLAALYSMIGLNLGGFFIGMLLGLIGAALVISWGPPRSRPAVQATDPQDIDPAPDHGDPFALNPFMQSDEPATDAADAASAGEEHDPEAHAADDEQNEDGETSEVPASAEQTQRIELAGHDDRPSEEHEVAGVVPGFDAPAETPRGGGIARLGRNPKALAIAIAPILLTVGILVASGRIPASAETCPTSLVSASASAAKAAGRPAVKRTVTSTKRTAKSTKKSTAKVSSTASKAKTTVKTAAAPSASDTEDASKHPIASVLDGIGNLLGVGDGASASPSVSPTPAVSSDPTKTPEPTKTTEPAPSKTTEPASSKTTAPASSKTTAPTPTTSASDPVSCLGPRAYGLEAGPAQIPTVADQPGSMQTASLTMTGFNYVGLTNLTTGSGKTVQVMEIDMSSVDNKPFTLTIPEKQGQTVIKSNDLTVSGNVRFFTTRFEGRLLGIKTTFTVATPPPSLGVPLPIPLTFTDVTVALDFIQGDKLTGIPLDLKPQN